MQAVREKTAKERMQKCKTWDVEGLAPTDDGVRDDWPAIPASQIESQPDRAAPFARKVWLQLTLTDSDRLSAAMKHGEDS